MSEETETLFNDPALYRKLSEPFATKALADESLQAFAKGVRALREKHGIQDVYIIAGVTLKFDDGVEAQAFVTANFGDELKAESLAAYALGVEQSRRQDRIARAIDEHRTIKTPRSGK